MMPALIDMIGAERAHSLHGVYALSPNPQPLNLGPQGVDLFLVDGEFAFGSTLHCF
jgi:hypothetical protein